MQAPEVVTPGQVVTGAADVWSLGVVLWLMLPGTQYHPELSGGGMDALVATDSMYVEVRNRRSGSRASCCPRPCVLISPMHDLAGSLVNACCTSQPSPLWHRKPA